MDQETLTMGSRITSSPLSPLQSLRQPSPLPPEILVQIFLLSLPLRGDPQAPQKTALALVCRLWGAIIDSTPVLWSRISITDSLTYIRKSLLKSVEHPIDVAGDHDTPHNPWAECGGVCSEFVPAVTLHAERWRHVSLRVWGGNTFTPSVTTFASLRSLELIWCGGRQIDDVFLSLLNGANTPHLRHVRLQTVETGRWDLVSFPPSLSTLTIEDNYRVRPSANRLLSILAACPNLTALGLYGIFDSPLGEGDTNGHNNVPAVVDLTALQELNLYQVPVEYVRELLKRLSIPDECMVSVTECVDGHASTSFLIPALSYHRESFLPATVTIVFVPGGQSFRLTLVRQRWRLELRVYEGGNIRNAFEWFGISTASSSNASSGSETLQAGSTTSNSTPVTLKLGKENESYPYHFEDLGSISDFQCISRIETDGLSARNQAAVFWYLSGPEDWDQPSRRADYDASDNPRPKKQTTGDWLFPGVFELVLKGMDAQAMRALLDAINRRSGDGAKTEASGMPAQLKRIEFVDGDEATERGDNYFGVDAHDTKRLVLEILDALDDDAELWWRGKRISKV